VTPAIRTAAGEFLKSCWGHCPTIGRIDCGNIREIDRQLLKRISEELSHNLLSMTEAVAKGEITEGHYQAGLREQSALCALLKIDEPVLSI
jgi:hypothetical protein